MTRLSAARLLPALDAWAIETWLRLEAVREDGSVSSWVSSAHPGYAYPEAAALWLRFAATRGLREPCAAVARRLVLDARRGGIGRGGTLYVFDGAVALAGLLAWSGPGHREECTSLARSILSGLSSRSVTTGVSPPPNRWSSGYNPHLLKALVGLRSWWEASEDPACWHAAAQLIADLRPPSSRFATGPDGRSYTHAWCYAVEGLMCATDWGMCDATPLVEQCATLLTTLQRADGGVPAWHDGGPSRADATAQAARLWLLLDRASFAPEIERALDWLGRAQRGGVLYESGSNDVNTWASLFALQAWDWYVGGADVRDLW